MRVLLLDDYPVEHGGGAEVHVGRLADVLREAGDDVLVHAPTPHRGARKLLDLWDPFHRRTVRRLVHQFRPDVVHVHNFQRELSASVLGVGEVPWVLTAHDYRLLRADEGPAGDAAGVLRRVKDAKARFERRHVRRRVDAVIAVSDHLADELRAAGLPEVRRLDCFAADPDGIPGPPGHDVVFVGQLIPAKGVVDLVEAFATIAADHPGVRLRIAGTGEQEPDLRALAADRVGDQIVFEGRLDDAGVRALMAEAAVVAVPSTRTTEGAPIVAMEAMLSGRPVVVTDSPAFRLLVDDGVHGAIVPIGDRPALAAALAAVLDDPARATAMGGAAFERAVGRFGASAAVHRFRALYRELAGRQGGTGT